MKPPRVSKDFVPVGEFKARTSRWLRQVARSDHPVVITNHGKPTGILLSALGYDRLLERQRFLESVAAGIADSEAGRLMDAKTLASRLTARREKHPRIR